jgi:hypothetical protein
VCVSPHKGSAAHHQVEGQRRDARASLPSALTLTPQVGSVMPLWLTWPSIGLKPLTDWWAGLGSLTARNPSWWGDGGRDSSAGEGHDKGDQGEPEGGARESLHGGQAVPFERMVGALVETLRPWRLFPPCTVTRGSA